MRREIISCYFIGEANGIYPVFLLHSFVLDALYRAYNHDTLRFVSVYGITRSDCSFLELVSRSQSPSSSVTIGSLWSVSSSLIVVLWVLLFDIPHTNSVAASLMKVHAVFLRLSVRAWKRSYLLTPVRQEVSIRDWSRRVLRSSKFQRCKSSLAWWCRTVLVPRRCTL